VTIAEGGNGESGGAPWRETNRAVWDEWAPAHADGPIYELDGLVRGRDDLRPWEDAEVGPVDGLDLVHLQCHLGTDTIGWARRGARVVGLDFSAPALAAASDLAERCGLDIEWIESDVYGAAAALGGRTFDVVYTGVGALNWLPDLTTWAQVVRSLLRPGGFLYLLELHPMWVALGDDGRTIREHAIDAPYQRWEFSTSESYGAPGAQFEARATYERLHDLGSVLSAVLDAGLTIELYHEFDVTPAPTRWLELRDDGLYHFADDALRFPLVYSVRARRPPED
jgi:SAM-dependent methyltransferase